MAKIVIFGIGQIAEVAHFYLTNDSEHEVVAFTVDKEFLTENTFHNLPVVPYEDILEKYPSNEYKMFIPISYKKVNKLRAEKFLDVKAKGYECISYISSKATYYNTYIGENCFILENTIIQPFVTIENSCIIWSGSHIGHHSTIKSNCFIAPCVAISGNCEVGENTFIGINATLRDGIKIGKSNVIGAGSIMLKDTEDDSVFSSEATNKSRVTSSRLRGF